MPLKWYLTVNDSFVATILQLVDSHIEAKDPEILRNRIRNAESSMLNVSAVRVSPISGAQFGSLLDRAFGCVIARSMKKSLEIESCDIIRSDCWRKISIDTECPRERRYQLLLCQVPVDLKRAQRKLVAQILGPLIRF